MTQRNQYRHGDLFRKQLISSRRTLSMQVRPSLLFGTRVFHSMSPRIFKVQATLSVHARQQHTPRDPLASSLSRLRPSFLVVLASLRRLVVPVPAGIDSRWRAVTAPAAGVCQQSIPSPGFYHHFDSHSNPRHARQKKGLM